MKILFSHQYNCLGPIGTETKKEKEKKKTAENTVVLPALPFS